MFFLDQGGVEGYVKLRKSLSSKSKKPKNPMKTSASPPRSTAPDVDLDSRFAAQLETVNQSMDQKLDNMSSTLMSKFASMLDQFKLGINNASFSGDPEVPGPSVSQTEPPSLQSSISTKSRGGHRFGESGEDPVPHRSGLAQGGVESARPQLGEDAAIFREPPPEASGKSQRPEDQSGPRVRYSLPTEVEYEQHPEEDDDDDKDRVAEPPVLDRTYARLINFIYDRLDNSRPSSSAHVPPRCEFEEFFAVSDPPTASRQNLTVYPRVAEIVDSSAEKASRLARESRPLHRVVPLRWKMFYVGDNTDYCMPGL